MNKETNQNTSKELAEDKIIYDKKEFEKLQEELVNKTDGKFFKNKKPDNVILKKKMLTKNLVSCLIFTYKHYKYSDVKITDYFAKKNLLYYLNDFPNITRNFHYLKYWDCIAQMPTSPNEVLYKKGWYGITENGIAFIQKEIALPKYALIHNDFAYEHITKPNVMVTDYFTEKELDELLKP